MKSYTVTQRVYSYDTFEEDDIPEGMTPEQYAEQRYCESIGDVDSHTLIVFEDDNIIYDGEALGAMDPVENQYDYPENTGGVVPDPSDDDLMHDAVMNHYFVQTQSFGNCDECSVRITDEEDAVHCPDGKIRCATCVEAMYRENGGE